MTLRNRSTGADWLAMSSNWSMRSTSGTPWTASVNFASCCNILIGSASSVRGTAPPIHSRSWGRISWHRSHMSARLRTCGSVRSRCSITRSSSRSQSRNWAVACSRSAYSSASRVASPSPSRNASMSTPDSPGTDSSSAADNRASPVRDGRPVQYGCSRPSIRLVSMYRAVVARLGRHLEVAAVAQPLSVGTCPKGPHQVRLAAAGLAEQHQDRPRRRRRSAAGAVQEMLERLAGLGMNRLHIVRVGLPDGGSAWRPSGTLPGNRARGMRPCAGRRQRLRREQRQCSWAVPFEKNEVKRRVQIHSLGVGHQLRVHGLHEVGSAQVQQVLRVRLDQSLLELGKRKAREIRLPLACPPQGRDEHLVVVEPILGRAAGRQRPHRRGKSWQVERLGCATRAVAGGPEMPASQSRTTLRRAASALVAVSPVSNSGSCLTSFPSSVARPP